MKNRFKILIALSLVTVLVGFGSASATYAWYQLNLTKSISLRGTSLGHSAGLQIGFVTDADLSSITELTKYTPEDASADYGGSLYFLNTSQEDQDKNKNQSLTSDIVSRVLNIEGYSSSDIYPITPGAREAGEKIDAFYEPPGYKSTFESYHPAATKKEYIHLGLAFLTMTNDGNPVPSNVYLEDYAFSATQNANEAVRFYFESPIGDFNLAEVFKPASSEAGTTRVGGPLDLDQDGVYDYLNGKEVFYGQKKDGTDVQYGEKYASSLKGVTAVPNYDCFQAGNRDAGVEPLVNVDDYAATSFYDTLDKFVVDPSVKASKNRPIAHSDNNGIALLNIDIYLEGWDTHTVNQTVGAEVGATFSFTVLGSNK